MCVPDKLDILKMIASDRIFITLDGLRTLTQYLLDTTFLNYRINNGRKDFLTQADQEIRKLKPESLPAEKPIYDPSKPLELKFTILKDYMKQYE